MNLIVPHSLLAALWGAYEQPHSGSARPEAAAITARIAASGWAGLVEVESLLIATEPRLYRLATRALLAAFGIALQPVFERPTRGARDAEGIERVSAVDLARLLILLERAGLAVDPLPLCKDLAPKIAAKRLLTASELTVHWRAQGQPPEPLTLATKHTNIGCEGQSYLTPSGHYVRLFFEEEGDPGGFDSEVPGTVSMVAIDPPKGTAARLAKKHMPSHFAATA